MSLPIYQRVAVTDAGDVIPGAEYTVINENTGVAAPIYSDRTGATLLSAPYFADSVGTIQFFIAQGTTFRVAASGGVGTYTDRYVYGLATLLDQSGNLVASTSAADTGVKLTLNGNRSSNADIGSIFFTNNGDSVGLIRSTRAGADDAADMIFYTQAAGGDNDERLRITSTGNVGIGTSSPQTNLQINSNGGGGIRLERIDTAVGTGDSFGSIEFSQQDASDQGAGVVSKIESVNESSFSGYGALAFSTGNATSNLERVRIDSAGNLLVAKTSTSSSTAGIRFAGSDPGYSEHTRSGGTVMYLNRLSSDGTIMQFAQGNSAVGSIGSRNGAGITINSQGADGVLQNAGAESFAWNTGYFYPRTDNSKDLGFSALRWDDIYATNPNIITSDRNEKQDIQEIAEAETAVAKACKGLLRSFRWKSAVEKKGDDARIHFGIISQDLRDAFTAQGLDAGRYAMFVSSTWWETQTEVAAVEAVEGVEFVQAVEASEALYNEDGELVSEAVEAVEGVEGVEAVEAAEAYTRTDTFQTLAEAPAGATERTRLGVRYSELLAFIIAAL